jgi:hypothetical protein
MTPTMSKVFQSTRSMNQHSGIGAGDVSRKQLMLTKQGKAIIVVPVQFLKQLGWEAGTFVRTSVVGRGELQISPREESMRTARGREKGRILVMQGGSLALIYQADSFAMAGINPEGPVDIWIEDGALHVMGVDQAQTAPTPAKTAVEPA